MDAYVIGQPVSRETLDFSQRLYWQAVAIGGDPPVTGDPEPTGRPLVELTVRS